MALWRIGQVAERTGLSTRTLRYYEEIGLLPPSQRKEGGHRVYGPDDLTRLYRIGLLRQLGTPLAEIATALREERSLSQCVADHLAEVDRRLQALGHHRERVVGLQEALNAHSATDEELLAALAEVGGLDDGIRQRITLLVYDDIEAAHDFLVTVFGFGPGRLSRDDSGRVIHGELHVGDGVLWMHPSSQQQGLASPAALGASTHCMAVMVEDVDAHYARVLACGAQVAHPPRDMPYGVREYDVHDCEGGLWSFMSPIESHHPATETADSEEAHHV